MEREQYKGVLSSTVEKEMSFVRPEGSCCPVRKRGWKKRERYPYLESLQESACPLADQVPKINQRSLDTLDLFLRRQDVILLVQGCRCKNRRSWLLGRMQEPSLGRTRSSLLQEESNIVSAAQKLPLYRGELNEGSPFLKTITEPFAFSARTRQKSSWARRPRLPKQLKGRGSHF